MIAHEHLSPSSLIDIAFISGGNSHRHHRQPAAPGRAAQASSSSTPVAEQRERLQSTLGVQTAAGPDAALAEATVVWAIKPQQFKEAAAPRRVLQALHYSVMAGLRTDDMAPPAGHLTSCAPCPTPALVGRGVTGDVRPPQVTTWPKKAAIAKMIEPTGQHVWVGREADLDAVTALSAPVRLVRVLFHRSHGAGCPGHGPRAEQNRRLALATFGGATALAAQSSGRPRCAAL